MTRYFHISQLAIYIMIGSLVATTCNAQGGRGFGGGRGMGGDPTFATDRDVFHFLLSHHDDIDRTVTKLPDGVETLTESDNPAVAKQIREHVAAMYDRVKEHRPIRLRDPLFAELFRHADDIEMTVERTDRGVRVVETSDNPHTAELIQAHAEVVSKFVALGFAEAQLDHPVPKAGANEQAAGSTKLTPEQREALLALSVEFDRVYIPALALTNEGKAKPAAMAIERLQESYDDIHSGVRSVLKMGPAAGEDSVRQRIDQAADFVAAGDMKEAHNVLEPIRDDVTQRRKELDLSYAVDQLNEYHRVMEAIAKPAVEMTPADVDAAYLGQLRNQARLASEAWVSIEQTNFSPHLFGLDPQHVAELESSIALERKALTTLNRALARDDEAAILKAANAVRPPFAKAYKTFGDFHGLQPREGEHQ